MTPAGEALLPYARDALAALTAARLAVAAVDQRVRATVELIANESVSTYLLPHALGEVRRQWPQMHFAVTVGMCPQITSGLSGARYECRVDVADAALPPRRRRKCSPAF
jgi:DNA-binding transcriptional LysR family regulator